MLAAADAVLAMIGPGWLTAATVAGEPRLYQAGDFVRTELSRALSMNLTVVPVLVGGATMPAADELPPDLTDLTRRQAVVVRDEAFHADVDRLLKLLRGEPERRPGWISRRRPALAAAAALLLIVAGGLTWWFRDQAPTQSRGSSGPTGCPSTGSGTWTDIALAAHPSGTVPYASGGTLTFTVNAAKWRLEQPGQWQIVLNTQMENAAKTSASHESGKYRSVRVALRDYDVYCFDPPEPGQEPGTITDAHVGFNVTCLPTGAMSLILQYSNEGRQELPFTADTTPASCVTSST